MSQEERYALRLAQDTELDCHTDHKRRWTQSKKAKAKAKAALTATVANAKAKSKSAPKSKAKAKAKSAPKTAKAKAKSTPAKARGDVCSGSSECVLTFYPLPYLWLSYACSMAMRA